MNIHPVTIKHQKGNGNIGNVAVKKKNTGSTSVTLLQKVDKLN